MGQEQSTPEPVAATPDQLSTAVAHRFANACFTPLELAHFKDNFRTLADTQDGLQYWKEETLGRFLAVPDVLGVRPVIFQIASYLGAFPFPSRAPAILTREALVKVIVLMTERYQRVLKGGARDRTRLLFRAMAVFDRRASTLSSPHPAEEMDALRRDKEAAPDDAIESPLPTVQGFAADAPRDEDESDDEDALALAALDALDAIEVYSAVESTPHVKMLQAQIPIDNFRRLLMFLILASTLENPTNMANVAGVLLHNRMRAIRQAADAILWSFAPEEVAGIAWGPFRRIVNNSLPHLFDGFGPLFEHFLFSKNLDLHRLKKTEAQSPTKSSVKSPTSPRSPGELPQELPTDPILPRETELLDLTTLSQLSFFVPSPELFRHLRLLYSGNDAGFSINALTHKILNWRAPTILLVSGTRVDKEPATPRERSFSASLPPRRFPEGESGNVHPPPGSPALDPEKPRPISTTTTATSKTAAAEDASPRLVFGTYLTLPWKQTPKTPLTDPKSLLFQLSPLHDVFRPSDLDRNHVTLSSDGLGVGCPLAPASAAHRAGAVQQAPLGPVSLWLDANLEFGVFTHTRAGGGAYAASRAGRGDWQERFTVDALEVWGCGGDEEAARQRQAWAWEEREAEARRHVKLGKGDKDADYALLEMAGLVGGHGNSGGSMG